VPVILVENEDILGVRATMSNTLEVVRIRERNELVFDGWVLTSLFG